MQDVEMGKRTIWGVGPRIVASVVAVMLVALALTRAWPGLFGLWWISLDTRLLVARVLGGCGLFLLGTAAFIVKRAFAQGRLITSGPYAWVRHPIYTAWLLFVLPAVAIACGSWLMLAGPAFGVLVFHRVIHKEERQLEALFGEEYLAYRQRVPALIPRLSVLHGLHS